jgi:erythromycin esterase
MIHSSLPARTLLALLAAVALAACDSPTTTTTTPPVPPIPPAPPGPPLVADAPKWLAANAHPIATLSVTSDFRDLEPLRAAIGNARVVMLGEQSHADGTTFLAKARLIAFLHQQMGFDVLAWESGIYDVHEVWDHIRAGQNVLTASRRGIFGIWTWSEQVLPTLDYVASTLGTARPLEMAGFDNQLTGTLARDSLAAHVLAFARSINSPVATDAEWPAAAATLTELAVTGFFEYKPAAVDQARLIRILTALRADAAARGAGDREALFWTQALASIQSYLRMMSEVQPGLVRPEDNNPRDAQMAANLVWLANTYYRDRKIIVWAASSHIARAVADLRATGGERPYATGWTVRMGAEAHRVLGADMYSIGFTAATGTRGRPGFAPVPLRPMLPESIEAYFAGTSFDNAFVDFRKRPAGGEWLTDVYSRPFGYTDLRGDWTAVFDGMVFTRVMTPSTSATR